MAKKIFFTIFFAILALFTLASLSFAESNEITTKLGNEVTESMNKTERSMDDLGDKTGLDKAGKAIDNGVKDTGKMIDNGAKSVGRDMKDGMEDLVGESNKVAGRTGNYASSQIQGEVGRNGMTANAWIWIVMAVVALVIIAAVWFYAMQRD